MGTIDRGGHLTTNGRGSPGGVQGLISVEMLKAKRKIKVEASGNKIKVDIKIDMRGMLGEETAKVNLSKPSVISDLEKENSRVVKEIIMSSIARAQEYKSDIFGFGQSFHRQHPKEWKKIKNQWNELFSEADVTVEVKTKISRTGLANIPIKLEKGK